MPGPKTTRAGLAFASSEHTGGSWRRPSGGTLPDRQPSRRISRPRLAVRTSCLSGPWAMTTTESSPKSRLKSSVAAKVLEPRSTRVSVSTLGSRRRARAAPARASTATMARVSRGRRVAARAMRAKSNTRARRPKMSPLRTRIRLGEGPERSPRFGPRSVAPRDRDAHQRRRDPGGDADRRGGGLAASRGLPEAGARRARAGDARHRGRSRARLARHQPAVRAGRRDARRPGRRGAGRSSAGSRRSATRSSGGSLAATAPR